MTDAVDTLYVDEQECGFKFAMYRLTYHISNDEPKWWLVEPAVTIDMRYVGSFDNENGWYVYDVRDRKLLGRNSALEQDVLKRVKQGTPINNIDGDYTEMVVQATAFETKKAAANETKRANSKTTLLEEMRSNYRPKAIDEAMLTDMDHGILHEVYSTKDDMTSYMAYCTKCGKTFETGYLNHDADSTDNVLECPDCGTTSPRSYSRYGYNYGSKSTQHTVVLFENTNLPENDLLVRVFEVNRNYSLEHGYTQSIGERQRVFFGKKINVYGRPYNYSTKTYGDFEKYSVRDVSDSLVGYRREDSRVVQDGAEIAQIIRNSCLMYSGLVESYGYGDKRYKGYESAPSMKYLMAWYKKPAIELLLKSNMTEILDHMIKEPDHMGSGKSVAEALDVPASVAKIAMKLNLDYRSLTALTALYIADSNLTAEQFLAIQQMRLPTFQLAQLKTRYNIDFAQTTKYLDAVYNHQCIERRDAIELWLAYLKMATDLHIDLTDKSRLYPGSLKKEHDVATFAYRAVQIDMDKEKFASQAEQNAYFEYTYKDLMVIVPKTPQEIVEEATRQKNCLRSYVERVKNGDTVVVFIRRKIMPDATYVTAEVHNGSLIQLKGYCNSNPRNKELVEFVQHWSKAKGIRVEC
jgi:DNA-directed RNA polymerase subunit RPC12/RpoP